MDQLIFASLSHTHYWYEVGMLKVPGAYVYHSCQVICFRKTSQATVVPGHFTQLLAVVLGWFYTLI